MSPQAKGKWLHFTPSASGAVSWNETTAEAAGAADDSSHSTVSKPTKGESRAALPHTAFV